MITAYITHPACLKHEMFTEHPECPSRLSVIEDHLKARGLFDFMHHFTAPKATITQLERAHSSKHIRRLMEKSPAEGIVYIDADTAMNPFSLEAAFCAAGAGVLAVEKIMSGDVNNAFCNIRPPGHHAEQEASMGFCFFNNIAVAALHAIEKYALKRIAVVDFDVHHGNGSEDILQHNPHVLYFSTFQHPFYPHSSTPEAENIINIPLSEGVGSAEYRYAFTQKLLPRLEAYQPDMLFISAGFDAHHEDDMAGLNLVDSDYLWITRALMGVANKTAQGRVVSMLEGGYALEALGRSATEHVRVLMGMD